jgi:hypothetical protein
VQDILGLGDNDKLKSAAGFAGGIGHQGAACGIVVAATLALGLANPEQATNPYDRAALSCARTRKFLQHFKDDTRGIFCRDISRTDFDDDRQLRSYYLTKSRHCIKLASISAALLVDSVDDKNLPEVERFARLNSLFSENGFHCAHSTFMNTSERLGAGPTLSLAMLVPLNGGIAYSGATCGALLGGCLMIGLKTCGDMRKNSIMLTLRRTILAIAQGGTAFNRTDLSPANDALLRCAELYKWFEGTYGSTACREITKTDFDDETQAGEYFEQGLVAKCISIAEETGAKAAQLTR